MVRSFYVKFMTRSLPLPVLNFVDSLKVFSSPDRARLINQRPPEQRAQGGRNYAIKYDGLLFLFFVE